ncbi:MAG: hypothetical protein M3417_14430, partial [Actinomycetota bacterium]|nr:hypothetical protein [Actinomycetota bacterium]
GPDPDAARARRRIAAVDERRRLARARRDAGPAVPIHLCGPEGIRRTTTLGELLPLGFGAGSLPG